MSTIKYEIKKTALAGKRNNNTIRLYLRAIDRFWRWAKAKGIRSLDQVTDVPALIEEYVAYLTAQGYTASTIHSYVAPITYGLRFTHDESRAVRKPRRVAAENIRGRGPQHKDAQRPEFGRLVAFQSVVGIRRAELARLTTGCLVRDESGYLCVHVRRGKGGKEQLQRILPGDEELVQATFNSSAGIRVFTVSEMQNKIDLHKLRAEQARRAYDYYLHRIQTEPDYPDQLVEELSARYMHLHRKATLPGLDQFLAQLTTPTGKTTWDVKGASKQRAMELGRPNSYDRLALLAVSVFHLSHWRLDVTVSNYMIA